VLFREATRADLPAVLALITDDVIGRDRDSAEVDEAYERAFAAIDADPRNLLAVADDGGAVVGCLQLTFIPGLGRHGAERCLVEAVRVRSDRRGSGIGGDFMRWVVERARERGCALVQLTTDKRRPDAHRFYRALGFTASHEGMKLPLTRNSPGTGEFPEQ
jgi:GNAT superfamily N-acetyltransferase